MGKRIMAKFLEYGQANWFVIAVLTVLLMSTKCYAKHLHPERYYQGRWCKTHNGIMEYKLDDGTRIDCLTDKLAVEVDFAPKWHECIGQALYYGRKTHKIPACVLILENPEDDMRFVKRLRYTVYQKKKIPEFKTFTIKPPDVDMWIMEDISEDL